MDTFLQRDNLQKAAFLKDLTSFWTRFDSRILCYKVSRQLRHCCCTLKIIWDGVNGRAGRAALT